MGKGFSISKELGLTQLELSLILGVNRSLLSMYELNLRSLPSKASLKLSEIQVSIAESQKEGKGVPTIQWQREMYSELESLLSDNAWNRTVLERKITKSEQQNAEVAKAVHIHANIAKQPTEKSAAVSKYIEIISNKTSEWKQRATGMALFKLQMKLQLLELEKKILENKFQEVGKQG